jgi:hypothetical protein
MGLDLSHIIPTDTGETFEYFTMEELNSNPEFVKRYIHMFKEYEGELVLFFDEIGSQRSGMNKEFYKAFENCKPYFDKKSVEEAMSYLKPNDPFGLNFKKDFVDNFVAGESVFYASW